MDFPTNLADVDSLFPADYTPTERAEAKTRFLKNLSLAMHRYYGGKMETIPKCPVYGLPWFNVYYTPGVSSVSQAIRDDVRAGRDGESFALSSRGNTVAVVSDSTRVLGDGDCTPSGGLGVMEGKAMLMKYLGGVDAVPLCVNTRGPDGKSDPARLIDFVRMAAPSFGAVNLEDISSPACYRVLDELRDTCGIPVWHDDAQGTACVTLAALLNALRLAGKPLDKARIVLAGAGAANTTIARLILLSGGSPERLVVTDSRGCLHKDRADIASDPRNYRKWELCVSTNPQKLPTLAEALKGADALIAASRPGPGTIAPEAIRTMSAGSIVFACANPVPEIWPHEAKEAGAYITATGRGDFPNQVNNSVCFPGILKGVLLVRAKSITDEMALRCAVSLASFSERRGITPDNIIASMDETEVFAQEAADVADEACKAGLARCPLSAKEVYDRALADIKRSRALAAQMLESGFVQPPPKKLLEDALKAALQRP